MKIGDLVVTKDGEQGKITGWDAFPIRHQTAFVQVGNKEVQVPKHHLERVTFKKGDRISAHYIGHYPFEGTVTFAEQVATGWELAVKADKPIILESDPAWWQDAAPKRVDIFVHTAYADNQVKKI